MRPAPALPGQQLTPRADRSGHIAGTSNFWHAEAADNAAHAGDVFDHRRTAGCSNRSVHSHGVPVIHPSGRLLARDSPPPTNQYGALISAPQSSQLLRWRSRSCRARNTPPSAPSGGTRPSGPAATPQYDYGTTVDGGVTVPSRGRSPYWLHVPECGRRRHQSVSSGGAYYNSGTGQWTNTGHRVHWTGQYDPASGYPGGRLWRKRHEWTGNFETTSRGDKRWDGGTYPAKTPCPPLAKKAKKATSSIITPVKLRLLAPETACIPVVTSADGMLCN